MPKKTDELDERIPRTRSLDFKAAHHANKTGNSDFPEDDSVPIQPSSSPQTPRKSWERQYRGFLSRRKPPSIPDEKKDTSVRGGSLFKSVFGGGNTPKQGHHGRKTSHGSVSSELDDTRRRGMDKAAAHSPSSVQLRSEISMDSIASAPGSLLQLRPREDAYYSVNSRYVHYTPPQPTIAHKQHPSQGSKETDSTASLTSTPPSIRSLSLKGSDRKKAFTEFHNNQTTGVDSALAFLGDDDKSVGNHHGVCSGGFAAHARMNPSASHGSFFRSSPMEKIQESVSIKTDHRILKPIHGVDHWQPGRRYLIAPAALAACPMSVITTLWGNSSLSPVAELAPDAVPAGAILLGECLLSYATPSHQQESQFWSSAKLVLRQNYLLEYSTDASGRGIPRGYAHLVGAKCSLHPYFNDALQLTFFGSPCAQTDLRVLMIRLQKKEERESWIACLTRASNLSMADLYLYDEQNVIGNGHYATIYKARRRYDSKDCALKIFEKSRFWKLVLRGDERADTLVRETSVQATLTVKCSKHNAFVKLQGFFETSNHILLELEFVGARDLFHFMSERSTMEEKASARIIYSVLRGLEEINRVGIAHRDIKPANILISPSCVKLCDFGMATFTGVDGKLRGRCGTPGYVAPEIFSAGARGGYRNNVDIFSTGVTMYVLLCGYEPFYGESNAELIESNKKGDFEFPDEEWKGVSEDAKDLVQKMMDKSPENRPSPSEALRHPWFQKSSVEIDPLNKNDSISLIEDPGTCTIS